MTFDYEIPVKEYTAAQILYYKLQPNRRKRIDHALQWIVVGLVFIFVAWIERVLNWAPFLLGVIGACWIYAGVMNLYPKLLCGRAYKKSGLNGKKVDAESCGWRVRWADVQAKGENEQVFMLYSGGTSRIFIFGKQYLTDEQQRELRTLAGLQG